MVHELHLRTLKGCNKLGHADQMASGCASLLKEGSDAFESRSSH